MPRVLTRDDPDDQLVKIVKRIESLERIARMPSSSIRDGLFRVLDASGNDRIRMGKLPDGTYGIQIISAGVTVNNDVVGSTYQPSSGEDPSQGNTTSATYTDLGSVAVGPSLIVPVSTNTRLLVVAGAVLVMLNDVNGYGRVSYGMSGANTLAASDSRSAVGQFIAAANTTVAATLAVTRLHTGLLAGNTTITMKYRSDGTHQGYFSERFIFAIPL